MAYLAAHLLWMGLLFCTLIAFDRVVRRVYARNPQGWNDEGRPAGCIFLPPGSSLTARANCSFRWTYRPPEWAAVDPEIDKAMRTFRCLYWLTMGSFLPLAYWFARL